MNAALSEIWRFLVQSTHKQSPDFFLWQIKLELSYGSLGNIGITSIMEIGQRGAPWFNHEKLPVSSTEGYFNIAASLE